MRLAHSLPLLALPAVLSLDAPKAQVYFLPAIPDQHRPASLNQYDANSLISHHLGFDAYGAVGDREQSWWNEMGSWLTNGKDGIGQGPQDSVLIVIQSDHPDDFIPQSMQPTFLMENPPPASMFTDLIHAYSERAHQVGDSVFSSLSPTLDSLKEVASPVYKALLDAFDVASEAAETCVRELEMLVGFVDEKSEQDENKELFGVDAQQSFSAFEVKGLAELQREKGRQSEQYLTAAKTLQAVLSNPALQDRKAAILVVPSQPSASRHSKRQSRQKQPVSAATVPGVVFSVSTCFASNETCAETTNSCSGHGSCVPTTRAGKTCYTCACSVTRNDQGRRQWWAGAGCEKLDLSTSFVLLAGTTIFLIILVIFSAGLLYSVGGETLPNTLTAGAVSHVKRD